MRTSSIVLVAAVSSLIGAAAAIAVMALVRQADQHRLPDLENAIGIRAWDVHIPPDTKLGVRLATSDGIVDSSGTVNFASAQKLRLVMHSDPRERSLKHVCFYGEGSCGWLSIRVPDKYQIEWANSDTSLAPGSLLAKYGEQSASDGDQPRPGEIALTLSPK